MYACPKQGRQNQRCAGDARPERQLPFLSAIIAYTKRSAANLLHKIFDISTCEYCKPILMSTVDVNTYNKRLIFHFRA
jgi:hypothetical protein